MLRLNFRYQKWLDVLEWLAKQAGGLSLFCDHPPEGTFNYTDPKEYTVTEALDLVNGVLLMKGYSLVRHEQMLVCIDLSEPIPIGLTDVVTPEQAESRGKFELVTCTFPLAGRDAAAASAEIKLLLGSYSKVVPLAATGQLQVTDAAGNMKAHQRLDPVDGPGGIEGGSRSGGSSGGGRGTGRPGGVPA